MARPKTLPVNARYSPEVREKRSQYTKRWRARNPEKVKAQSSQWRAKHPTKAKDYARRRQERLTEAQRQMHIEANRKYYERNREIKRLAERARRERKSKDPEWVAKMKRLRWISHLKVIYGLTGEEAEKIEIQRAKGCQACGSQSKIHIDHDHKTGRVRGILCALCNSALGYARDNPEILQKLIVYLRSKDEAQNASS